MLEAVLKALEQLPSRPFRAVLLKSAGLALLLLIVLGIAADRVLAALIDRGGRWFDAAGSAHLPLEILSYVLALAAGIGILAGAVLLMPVVTALVAGFFVDEIAERVEQRYYPADPPGQPLPVGTALMEGVKAALFSLVIYACALAFLWVAGLGVMIFFLATAYVQGRVFFELAAMRYCPVESAKQLRELNRGTVFAGGIFIAAFLSVPIVSLAAPLFGTALMIHVYKGLVARPERPLRGA